MGAPARTWFCKNGHVAEDYFHHQIGPDNEGENPCFCGETELKSVHEWQDEDCWDDGNPEVPLKEIRIEEKYILAKIPVFDVTKLFGG